MPEKKAMIQVVGGLSGTAHKTGVTLHKTHYPFNLSFVKTVELNNHLGDRTTQ